MFVSVSVESGELSYLHHGGSEWARRSDRCLHSLSQCVSGCSLEEMGAACTNVVTGRAEVLLLREAGRANAVVAYWNLIEID